jgi:glutathione S-transferase
MLTLYSHPLASFCQKVLIGLYELDLPFTHRVIDLFNDDERAELATLWPIVKFPVLRDAARGVTIPETTIILEYLDQHYARERRLVPTDPDGARECRLYDRFYDLYVNVPMGKVVTDRLRPDGEHDRFGVAEATTLLETAYGIADEWMRGGPWAVGEMFSIADCAAAPALFYASHVVPFRDRYAHLARYYARLESRPSFARVLEEAKPYMSSFPLSGELG